MRFFPKKAKKKKVEKPWEDDAKLAFGTDENDMNAKLVKQLNLLHGVKATKIPGTSFKTGIADILGSFDGTFLALENKFIHEVPTKAGTMALKPDVYSVSQREFLEGHLKVSDPSSIYLGSIVGVYGKRSVLIAQTVHRIMDKEFSGGIVASVVHSALRENERSGASMFWLRDDTLIKKPNLFTLLCSMEA